MLRMALVMAIIVSSSTVCALNNSDLIQLNLRMSRQQEQFDLVQALEPMEQARLRQRAYQQELVWKQQEERIRQQRYLQQLFFERQRQLEARRIGEERERDLLLWREQSRLFQ